MSSSKKFFAVGPTGTVAIVMFHDAELSAVQVLTWKRFVSSFSEDMNKKPRKPMENVRLRWYSAGFDSVLIRCTPETLVENYPFEYTESLSEAVSLARKNGAPEFYTDYIVDSLL